MTEELDFSDEPFWFRVSLLKIEEPPVHTINELQENATHVCGPYWIFEGDLFAIGVPERYVVTEGAVPCLGGRTEAELIEIVDRCLDYKIPGEFKTLGPKNDNRLPRKKNKGPA